MSSTLLFLLRATCLVAMLAKPSAAAFAQSVPEEAARSLPLKTVSATQVGSGADQALDLASEESTQASASEPFQLPRDQHPWARFQPGAWRELRIVSETFGETGQAIGRSVTRQKEVLQAVDEGKYVLNVQATVDLSGKRIVGGRKVRVLNLATDGAGPLIDSRRLEDQSLQLAGRAAVSQVWEVRYRDGARNLTDRIFYDSQRFPFVLRRETSASDPAPDNNSKGDAVDVQQLIEVTAPSVSYLLGEAFHDCSCLRTLRHHAKGESLRLAFTCRDLPGGEVAVWSTDADVQGRRVRSSFAELLNYGESSPVDDPGLDGSPRDAPPSDAPPSDAPQGINTDSP